MYCGVQTKLMIIIIYFTLVNQFQAERNPLEYTGSTELFDFLLKDYDKRVDAKKDGILSIIHLGIDVLWLNIGKV